jgi:CDP-glycerol glycerophosphotransferase
MYLVLKKHPLTDVVLYGSLEYFEAYATHQYWVVNCKIPFSIVKKVNQIFLQCWHGTPLKKIGL